MKKTKASVAIALVLAIVFAFPLWAIDFIAAESVLTHITFVDDGAEREFFVSAYTVDGFLFEAGIALNGADRLSHPRDAILMDGMVIYIDREVSFYIQFDGSQPMPRTASHGTTIGTVLSRIQEETNISLIFRGDDTEFVENGDILHAETFLTRLEIERIPLPYEVIENFTSSVSQGRQHLRVVGEYGEKAITTNVVYIAGTENNREVVRMEVLTEPINAILDIGTGWLGSLTDTSAADFHYVRRIRMEATAYTAGYCCTGKHPDDPWYGITASGRRVEHGIVAVDRDVIPLGTRLFVEGYGFAIAADVGGAIRGYKIDLFMYDLADAIQFGRRHLYVWILDEI